MNKKLKKYIILAMMLAIAIILNLIENQIALIPVPGAKIGFANIVTLVVLFVFGFAEAMTIAILRVVFVSLVAPGRFLSPLFFMGLAGGVLSVCVMWIFKKINFFGIIGASIMGALAHVVGQVAVGYFIIGEGLFVYLPLMLLLSLVTGFLIGLITLKFVKLTKGWLFGKKEELKENKPKKLSKSQERKLKVLAKAPKNKIK